MSQALVEDAAAAEDTTTSVAAEQATKLRILFVASECAPYAKTGGLGDVVAALPKALRRLGHDVRIILPLYRSIDRARFGITFETTACVHMGQGEENWVGVYVASLDGEVPVWFVDYERFFGRPGIYDHAGKEYQDNAFRFALLSKSAMQICKDRGFIPHIMHAHDWPSALVAVFLKTWDRVLSPLSATASVLTIHNVGYQGLYHSSAFPYIGVGSHYFNSEVFEYYGQLNLLKAGIHFADALTTVSPTHAREILGTEGGMGLSHHLQRRRDDLFGILNGVDYEHWNPATDQLIPARYTPEDLSGKAVCKAALQEKFGLEQRPELPVFGIVSRFAQQKGFNLLREALPFALRDMLMQLVVLGTGDRETEKFFQLLASSNVGRVGSYIGFSNELSHLIEAGSDFFLMPSLYEPCGLNQSYSMKYGTLPVVRATGGLDDTVQNYDEATGTGTGFKFREKSGRALYDSIGWAVSTWFDRPEHMARLRRQAMAQDFSWSDSALKYVEVYEHALRNKRLASV
jgi:starch synthase